MSTMPTGSSYRSGNTRGAISPTNTPPSAPPTAIATKNAVRWRGCGFMRASSPWHTMHATKSVAQ